MRELSLSERRAAGREALRRIFAVADSDDVAAVVASGLDIGRAFAREAVRDAALDAAADSRWAVLRSGGAPRWASRRT